LKRIAGLAPEKRFGFIIEIEMTNPIGLRVRIINNKRRIFLTSILFRIKADLYNKDYNE
jgi:hypothetical protein